MIYRGWALTPLNNPALWDSCIAGFNGVDITHYKAYVKDIKTNVL